MEEQQKTVKAHKLVVNNRVDLSGTIDSVSYSNISQAKKQEESFWTKMFK